MRLGFRLAFALAASALSAAGAAPLPCEPVVEGTIAVDGLLDDWAELAGVDVGGKDPPGFSFTVKCNYDSTRLYLVVDVRDDSMAHHGGGGRGGGRDQGRSHVEIAILDGARLDRLTIHPADEAAGAKRKVSWSSGRSTKGVELFESRQVKGWAVELALRWKMVPEWSPGVPSIHLGVGVADGDARAAAHPGKLLSTSPLDAQRLGTIEFAESKAAFEALLKDLHLEPGDVLFDKTGRVGASGSGRAIVAGRYVAILTDEYAYIDLPIHGRKDILEVRLADLGGDGRDSILVRYVERAGAGSREVLGAYRITSEGLRRSFGVELAKAEGAKRLSTRYSLVKKGKATDILVEALPALGWTEATWHEAPAEDIAPLPLPWGDAQRARFQFRGETYSRAE